MKIAGGWQLEIGNWKFAAGDLQKVHLFFKTINHNSGIILQQYNHLQDIFRP